MRFNFFWKNLKTERENYVKEFKVSGDVKIEPCEKFVACLDKLSRNYVLALKSGAEIMQVANNNDIEFFEGYEITPSFTDSVRKNLSLLTKKLYIILGELIESLNDLDNKEFDNKDMVNDIKLSVSVINKIVLNMYQHLTMTFDVPEMEYNSSRPSGLKELLNYIKMLIISAVEHLNNIASSSLIEYISRAVDNIINQLLNYYNKLNE